MDFDALIAPLTREEFRSRFRQGACFVIEGNKRKFSDLITLQDVENRLNDGCNLNSPVVVIEADGRRRACVDRDVSWSSVAVEKRHVLERFANGQGLAMANLSQINPSTARLLDTLEEALSDHAVHADLRVHISMGGETAACQAVRDYPPHNIHLQIEGSTQWRIYHHDPSLPGYIRTISPEDETRYLEEAANFTLTAGDLFYMPPAVFHKARSAQGPHMSLTIPLIDSGQRHRMDRTHIPITELFVSGLQKHNATDLEQ